MTLLLNDDQCGRAFFVKYLAPNVEIEMLLHVGNRINYDIKSDLGMSAKNWDKFYQLSVNERHHQMKEEVKAMLQPPPYRAREPPR